MLFEICDKIGIPKKCPVKDVPTCWNSTAELVKCGIKLHPALDCLMMMAKFNKPGSVRLGCYCLSTEDWETLEALLPMLEVHFWYYFTNVLILIHTIVPHVCNKGDLEVQGPTYP